MYKTDKMAALLKGIISQQRYILCKVKFRPTFHAWVSTRCQSDEKVLCHKLEHRGLIKASGKDTSDFLQGLITNDMSCLDKKCEITSLYTLLLNVQGRVLYDLILYKVYSPGDIPSYLVECDKEVLPEVISTIKRYRIRKKVTLEDKSDELQAWALCPDSLAEANHVLQVEFKSENKQAVVETVDPRIKTFGRRLVLPTGVQAYSVVENAKCCLDTSLYHTRRYRYGLGEGIVDMPPGNSLPLESNAEFLNGVSFEKGCYIGQELTARTHHTGVIRKRLMPLQLVIDEHKCQPGDTVKNPKGKNCGKLRSSVGTNGLALLRVEEALVSELSVLSESGTTEQFRTWIPQWWPRDKDEILKKALAGLHVEASKEVTD